MCKSNLGFHRPSQAIAVHLHMPSHGQRPVGRAVTEKRTKPDGNMEPLHQGLAHMSLGAHVGHLAAHETPEDQTANAFQRSALRPLIDESHDARGMLIDVLPKENMVFK